VKSAVDDDFARLKAELQQLADGDGRLFPPLALRTL
jgi:hypothetical protein